MENTISEPAEAPAPKRKRSRPPRKAKPRPAAAEPAALPKFAGMTGNDCPLECNVDRCIISGRNYCGHPYKGGLRHGDMTDTTAIKQMQEAKLMLARQALEKKAKA